MGSHACKKSNINVTGIVHSKIKILHVIPNSCITSSANKKLYNIVSFSARKIFYLIGSVINLLPLKDGTRSFLS